MKKNSIGLVVIVISLMLIIPPTTAVVAPYFNDLAGFNSAAGTPAVRVDFDSTGAGTDISGIPINGITFNGLIGGAPPIVIKATDSFTPAGFSWSGPGNVLTATSGENILSPGGPELAPGPNPSLENDDIELLFNTPVDAAGFDLLFQSLDGYSYVKISVFDAGNNLLYENTNIPIPALSPIPGTAGSPGGSIFVGFVSDGSKIAKIVIDEMDGNNVNPDSNIGIDTIRADPLSPPEVPEFPTLLLPVTMIIGFLGAVFLIQRTKEN